MFGAGQDIDLTGVRMCDAANGNVRSQRGASIDELLDRVVAAINRGDRAAGLAGGWG
jgi:hypothetical protein